VKASAALPGRGELSRGWTDNIGLKLFALTASIVAFSLVHSEEEAERTFELDVVALLPPPDSRMMLIGERPDRVKVTLRGSRSQINSLERDSFPPVQIDLTDTTNRYFHFDDADIDVPVGAQIVQIEPPTIKLTWAERAEKRVAIKARLTGSPQEGLSVKKPVTLIPSNVSIAGPRLELASIPAVYTDIIVVDGLGQGKHERRVPLEPLPDNVTYQEDRVVVAQMEIVPQVAERTLIRLEVASVGEGQVSFRPSRVAVILRGPPHVLGNIDPEHLVPYVDIGDLDLSAGAQPRPVKFRGVPDGVELVRVTPNDVLVKPQ
jgi:YbbR domain-containing protein